MWVSIKNNSRFGCQTFWQAALKFFLLESDWKIQLHILNRSTPISIFRDYHNLGVGKGYSFSLNNKADKATWETNFDIKIGYVKLYTVFIRTYHHLKCMVDVYQTDWHDGLIQICIFVPKHHFAGRMHSHSKKK